MVDYNFNCFRHQNYYSTYYEVYYFLVLRTSHSHDVFSLAVQSRDRSVWSFMETTRALDVASPLSGVFDHVSLDIFYYYRTLHTFKIRNKNEFFGLSRTIVGAIYQTKEGVFE